jgi:hypothetical protein
MKIIWVCLGFWQRASGGFPLPGDTPECGGFNLSTDTSPKMDRVAQVSRNFMQFIPRGTFCQVFTVDEAPPQAGFACRIRAVFFTCWLVFMRLDWGLSPEKISQCSRHRRPRQQT